MKRVLMQDVRKTDYYYEEAIETLLTNIKFAGKDVKTILLTSCYPNEGKSDITFSLAREMAASGKRASWIQMVRKSTYALRFRVAESASGLSQFLSLQIGFQDLLYSTNYENRILFLHSLRFPIRQLFLGRGFFPLL